MLLLALALLLPATLFAEPLIDQPLTARIQVVRSFAGDVRLDREGNAMVDGKFLLNTGDPADFVTRLFPDGEVDLVFSLNARDIFGEDEIAPGVLSMAFQPDGRLLVAVGARNVDETRVATEIIRLRTDGRLDETFSTRGRFGTGDQIFSMRPLPNGSVLLAGRFLTSRGNAASLVIQLRHDGKLDRLFASPETPLELAGLAAYALEPAGKGRFLVGKAPWQSLTVAEGNEEFRLSMINSTGGEMPAFGRNAGPAIRDGVYAVRRLKDGRVLVGGVATLARLMPDGTPDSFFKAPALASTAPQRPFAVRVIRTQPDGKILIGGDFVTPDGCAGLVRLLSDGQIDGAFERKLGRGFRSAGRDHRGVSGIAVQKDGKIIVAGSFETVNGADRRALARLNPDGSLDAYPAVVQVGLR